MKKNVKISFVRDLDYNALHSIFIVCKKKNFNVDWFMRMNHSNVRKISIFSVVFNGNIIYFKWLNNLILVNIIINWLYG